MSSSNNHTVSIEGGQQLAHVVLFDRGASQNQNSAPFSQQSVEKPSDKHENSRRTCDICARTVEPEHAGRWGDAFKCGEVCREPTLRVQGGTLINKEA